MPIYEFYCPSCHVIYSFFARTMKSDVIPSCPKNKTHSLQREVSRFAFIGKAREPQDASDFDMDVDESKMEQVMMEMAANADGLDEDNPRSAAAFMRAMQEKIGLPMGKNMEEALRRLESGEDPDKVEEEMGGILESDEPMMEATRIKAMIRHIKKPKQYPELYDM